MTRSDADPAETHAAAYWGTQAPRHVVHWLAGWWRVVHLGAVLMVLAWSPSSYRRDMRAALAREVVRGTAPSLLWFSIMSTLAGLVLIRIVWVTALSYGLTQYALEMVVRVLVLELMPLAASLFVALRYTLPQAEVLAALRLPLPLTGDSLRRELLPRVLAGMFAVLTLAAASGVVCLVMAYLVVYGITPWGFANYTRTVGQVFNPAVTLIFCLKTGLFGLTVALIPAASSVYDTPHAASRTAAELRALVRLFALLLLVEAASLIGNYA